MFAANKKAKNSVRFFSNKIFFCLNWIWYHQIYLFW